MMIFVYYTPVTKHFRAPYFCIHWHRKSLANKMFLYTARLTYVETVTFNQNKLVECCACLRGQWVAMGEFLVAIISHNIMERAMNNLAGKASLCSHTNNKIDRGTPMTKEPLCFCIH